MSWCVNYRFYNSVILLRHVAEVRRTDTLDDVQAILVQFWMTSDLKLTKLLTLNNKEKIWKRNTTHRKLGFPRHKKLCSRMEKKKFSFMFYQIRPYLQTTAERSIRWSLLCECLSPSCWHNTFPLSETPETLLVACCVNQLVISCSELVFKTRKNLSIIQLTSLQFILVFVFSFPSQHQIPWTEHNIFSQTHKSIFIIYLL